MKTMINNLIRLADSLDSLGLKKDADRLDQLISKAIRGEDFGDLMKLFDEPVTLEDTDEGAPIARRLTQIPEEYEVLTPLTDSDEPMAEKKEPGRLGEIKRLHELMKLKKMLENEKEEEHEVEVPSDLPVAPAEEESFEDEEEDENDADDGGLFEQLKEKLKSAPELLGQILQIVKDDPALLELLAL